MLNYIAALALLLPNAQATATQFCCRHSAEATNYCLTTPMADGRRTHDGAAASNRHRLGTLIRLDHRVRGRRYFRIEDRIGSGSQLDLWTPSCSTARNWGRHRLGYRVVTRR